MNNFLIVTKSLAMNARVKVFINYKLVNSFNTVAKSCWSKHFGCIAIKKEFALTITWLWLKCVLFDTENCSNIETFGTKAEMHIVLKKSFQYA